MKKTCHFFSELLKVSVPQSTWLVKLPAICSLPSKTREKPINWQLSYMFGKPPKTVLTDTTRNEKFAELEYEPAKIEEYLEDVLQLEAVACKDWLTNKVDRSVTGRIAKQQCAGQLQLPLHNV